MFADVLDVHTAIREWLEAEGVPFEERAHEVVSTAAAAAAARGTPLEIGAKTILFKVDASFALFAFSAARALHSLLVRRKLGVRRTRFATSEELSSLAGLERGAVPPFGKPILPFPLYADPSLLENRQIAFTPGCRDHSIIMESAAWKALAEPTVFPFVRSC